MTRAATIPDTILSFPTKTLMLSNLKLVTLVFFAIGLAACEESPPNAYHPKPFVEGYLIVDEPIEGIVVALSQPLTEPFSYANGIVSDAEVTVSTESNTYPLQYKSQNGIAFYAYPDTTIKVLPNTHYKLTIRLNDGTVLRGETATPERIEWKATPRPFLQYPKDTVRLPSGDSLRISWTPGNNTEWLISSLCLDTLEYGKYLDPPTNELNGRTNNLDFFETPELPTFNSAIRWGFLQGTSVNTVWTAFRWFGKHRISVYAPDKNMITWFKASRFQGHDGVEYNGVYGSITGGLGVFGSASRIQGDTFVLKK